MVPIMFRIRSLDTDAPSFPHMKHHYDPSVLVKPVSNTGSAVGAHQTKSTGQPPTRHDISSQAQRLHFSRCCSEMVLQGLHHSLEQSN